MSTITQNNRQPSADKPAPPVTLEQQRAQFAWDFAKEGTALAGDEYRNLADFLLWTNKIRAQDWPPNDAG